MQLSRRNSRVYRFVVDLLYLLNYSVHSIGVAPASTTSAPSQAVKEAPQGTCDGKMSGNFDLKNGTCAHEYVACSKDGRGWVSCFCWFYY